MEDAPRLDDFWNIVTGAGFAAVSLRTELVLLLLPLDQLLHAQKALGQRFRTWRTARNIDVDWNDLVHPFDHRVAQLEKSAAVCAGAHRDNVLRLGHLLVEQLAAKRHLVSQRTRHDHQVALTRGRPGHRSESIQVRAWPAGLHQLDP